MFEFPDAKIQKHQPLKTSKTSLMCHSCRKETKVSEKDAFFFCYAARLLSIFIFKTSLVFSIISFGKVILQK